MTEAEMFEKSFERPSNHWELSGEVQWDIDKRLGILDWNGNGAKGPMTVAERERFEAHYDYFKKKHKKKNDAMVAKVRQEHVAGETEEFPA